jgi:poly(A) polymerase
LDMTAKERRRLLYLVGADRLSDLVLLAWAHDVAMNGPSSRGAVEAWREHLAAAATWKPIELPVKGRDVLALGIPAGPKVGRLVDAVEAWWVENDFAPDREACLARLAELVRA